MTSHITRLSREQHQHAMALDNYSSYDSCVFPPLDCWDWDWDWELLTPGGAGPGAAPGDDSFPATTTRVESPGSSEASGSGNLQDAVADWGDDRCNKRQRMAAATPPPRRPATVTEDLQCLLESFRDSSAHGGDLSLSHGLVDTTIPGTEMEMRCSFISGEAGPGGASGREEEEAAQVPAAQGGGEEATAAAAVPVVPPPAAPGFSATVRAAAAAPLRLQKATAGAPQPHGAARRDDRSPPRSVVGCWCEEEREPSRASAGAAATTAPAAPASAACPSSLSLLAGEEKRGVGVLYPFAVVKPLGLDDGAMTTLSDVNRRILKRPARPVRHPVGAFACGPAVSAHGLGLSGKAVVSLTRIRTGGKGTITIIRTRG